MKRTVTAFSTREALFSDVDTSTVIAAVIIISYTIRRPMPNALRPALDPLNGSE